MLRKWIMFLNTSLLNRERYFKYVKCNSASMSGPWVQTCVLGVWLGTRPNYSQCSWWPWKKMPKAASLSGCPDFARTMLLKGLLPLTMLWLRCHTQPHAHLIQPLMLSMDWTSLGECSVSPQLPSLLCAGGFGPCPAATLSTCLHAPLKPPATLATLAQHMKQAVHLQASAFQVLAMLPGCVVLLLD